MSMAEVRELVLELVRPLAEIKFFLKFDDFSRGLEVRNFNLLLVGSLSNRHVQVVKLVLLWGRF